MQIPQIEQRLEKEFHVSWYIIAYKLAFGLIELAMGIIMGFAGKRLFALYHTYILRELSEEPHDVLARLSEHIIPHILTHNRLLVFYIILLGAAKVVGAIGLIYGQNWGVDLLVSLTFILFPFQVIGLIRHPSLLNFLYITIGILIALYLINFKPKEWASRVRQKVTRV